MVLTICGYTAKLLIELLVKVKSFIDEKVVLATIKTKTAAAKLYSHMSCSKSSERSSS